MIGPIAAEGPTAFEWLTFGVAASGVLLGLASLVWQAVTFTFTGARVKVETASGVTSYTGQSADLVITVEAMNVGRSAVEVVGWGLDLPDGQFIVAQQLPGNTPIPHTLEGGHRAMWMVPLAALATRPEALKHDPLKARGFVRLGNGKRARGDDPVEIARSVIQAEAAGGP